MQDKARRDVLRGSLDVMVLSVLADGRCYGYAIQKKLAAAGGQPIQYGTLYPLLHRLEADGLIKATWDRTTKRERKWYELTLAGKRELRRRAAAPLFSIPPRLPRAAAARASFGGGLALSHADAKP